MNRAWKLAVVACLVLALIVLAGCAAGSDRFVARSAGFWAGLWHGIIVVITFIIGLFTDAVRVYETHNTGGWYDFGFLIGLFISIGGSLGQHHKRWKRKLRRDEDWDEIARKVEVKVRRGIDRWLEEREKDEDEWDDIGRKIEEKIKRELRGWADS